MNIKRMNTILYCKNWNETVIFYRDKLKFPVHYCASWFVEFTVGEDARLSIADQDRTRQTSAEGRGVTLSFEVPSIDRTYHELSELDLAPSPVSDHPWNARVVYIRDPEGNRIEFWERILTR